ncbi:MAG: NUDIX hydrolase [Patescibacteria group bacterium]
MLSCTFEDGGKASFRHVVLHAIVEKDNKLLLEKRAGDILETGKWALPGGFLDRDETASMGILRELKEETGWKGKIIKLFRINTNPNRPKEDRQNVALEFIIKPLQQESAGDSESSKVEWIPIENLRLEELAFDHGETIKLYLKYRRQPFPIPFLV